MRVKPRATSPRWNLEPLLLIEAGTTEDAGSCESTTGEALLDLAPTCSRPGAIGGGAFATGGEDGKEARDLLTATNGESSEGNT